MTTLKQIIEESDKEFDAAYDSFSLTYMVSKKEYSRLKRFIWARDRKLIEGMRDLVKAKLDWWRSDGVVEAMTPDANLCAVTSLVEVYDLINQFLNQK